MEITSESTISDIVRAHYRTAEVFKKYNINYCCSGGISLSEACDNKKIDQALLLMELNEQTNIICLPNNLPYDDWKIDFLVEYIVNIYHATLFKSLPVISNLLMSLESHKKKYPELAAIHEVFTELSKILEAHNRHEEAVIFPYIRQLDSALRSKEPYGSLFVRTLRKPLNNIQQDHDTIKTLLRKMQELTNNYTFPEKACTNMQVLYHQLKEFHNYMVQHKHLENNVLFPRANQIEQQLLSN